MTKPLLAAPLAEALGTDLVMVRLEFTGPASANARLVPSTRQSEAILASLRANPRTVEAVADALHERFDGMLCLDPDGEHTMPDEWWRREAAAILVALLGPES